MAVPDAVGICEGGMPSPVRGKQCGQFLVCSCSYFVYTVLTVTDGMFSH